MFQSTRPRGARRNLNSVLVKPKSFNPRARAGRDITELKSLIFLPVSIHAPARGATTLAKKFALIPGFQSTRPRGARRKRKAKTNGSRRFNPRARAGRDKNSTNFNFPNRFQSTRPRGARLIKYSRTLTFNCFNPRARAGRDVYGRRNRQRAGSFNPRARAGRDAGVELD